MLQVSLERSYRSKNGNVTFVYKVSGKKSDLEKFETIQGEFHRTDDDGNPLWFTTRCIGDRGKLIITENDNVVPDMSEFDRAESLAKQYGGNLGQELAKASAARLLGGQPADEESQE